MSGKSVRPGLTALPTVAAVLGLAAALAAQEPGQAPAPAHHPAPVEQKRGSREMPTHDPAPEPAPALVLQRLTDYHAAWLAARAHDRPVPTPPPRPAGCGRHVCAVLVCADADLDPAPLLGLERKDLLVVAAPGPFATSEAVALLEREVAAERLSLVVVMTHTTCATLGAAEPATPAQRALADRVANARRRAEATGQPLARSFARAEAELVLASSELLRHAAAADRLRVVAAEFDAGEQRIRWHTSRADAMPMAPVR